jgi:excisionase family DNA binding protein
MHVADASAPGERPEARTGSGRRCVAVAVAARMLDIGPMTLYRAINAGQFPAIKFRDRWLVPVEAIDQLIEVALTTGAAVDIETWTPTWLTARRAAVLPPNTPTPASISMGGGSDVA